MSGKEWEERGKATLAKLREDMDGRYGAKAREARRQARASSPAQQRQPVAALFGISGADPDDTTASPTRVRRTMRSQQLLEEYQREQARVVSKATPGFSVECTPSPARSVSPPRAERPDEKIECLVDRGFYNPYEDSAPAPAALQPAPTPAAPAEPESEPLVSNYGWLSAPASTHVVPVARPVAPMVPMVPVIPVVEAMEAGYPAGSQAYQAYADSPANYDPGTGAPVLPAAWRSQAPVGSFHSLVGIERDLNLLQSSRAVDRRWQAYY